MLTPCEALWPTMMLSKLSRAASARPQQPLFRPRFTSQSFNRGIRTPRYQAKDTNLPKTPTPTNPFDVSGAIVLASFATFCVGLFFSPKEPVQFIFRSNEHTSKPDHKDTLGEYVIVRGSEEKSGQWGRKRVDLYTPDNTQSQDEEWRSGSNGRPAHSRRPVPAQLPAELLHNK